MELNTYSLVTDPNLPGSEVEQALVDLVRQVARARAFRSR